MRDHTRAEKIGALHSKLVAMAEDADTILAGLFDAPRHDTVGHAVILMGSDGVPMRLAIEAKRLTLAEYAAEMAKCRAAAP
jgi:hypothetical protein